MGQLSQKDLHNPLNSRAIRRLRGRLEKIVSAQAVAATLTTTEILDIGGAQAGNIQDLTFVAEAVAAANEDITVDVQKNGVTILNNVLVYDDTLLPGELIRLDYDVDTSFDVGDVVSVIRTYTAGGGPTPIAHTKVTLEVA